MTAPEIETVMMDWVRDNQNPKAVATATPAQMDMDSLDELEIVLYLEDELDISIPEEWVTEGLKTKSFAELSVMLAAKLNE